MLNHLIRISLILLALSISACNRDPNHGAERPSVVKGINYVGVSVENLQRSRDLYSNTMDLDSVAHWPANDYSALNQLSATQPNKVAMNLMKSSNAQLLFMQFENRSEQAKNTPKLDVFGPGIAHICFQVNKETQAYDNFLAAGGSTIGDPKMVQLNPKNPVGYAYVYDPDGSIVEIEHVDVAALNLPTPPKNDYRIRHVSLATSDIGRITKFYAKFLNQPKPRRAGKFLPIKSEKLDRVSGHPDSKIKMAWFQTRNLELEIIQYVSHPTEIPDSPRNLAANGYNMIVFEVSDLALASEQFKAAGGTLVTKPEPFLNADVVFGRDPDGNLIGLQASAADNPISSMNFSGNGT